MFLIGFICGVMLLAFFMLLCDRGERREYEEELLDEEWLDMQANQSWQQTRNFLYYDGTEMPIKKEEYYE